MNIRLGGGEYDGGEMATWEARTLFLDAVARVEPEVLASLRADVLPHYDSKKIVRWGDAGGDLRIALEGWAARFNIAFEWVYQTALVTLWCWSIVDGADQDEIAGEWQHDTGAYWLHTTRGERRIAFNHAGWDPAGETRGDFKRRMMAEFTDYLESYLQKLGDLVEGRGLEKASEIRNPDQFEWLAMWQVAGYETFGEIAKDVYTSRQAVTLGIQRAAGKCGIPVPRGEPGRPGAVGKPANK